MKIEYVYDFLLVFRLWTLISAPGTRFPLAVREPPRLAPVGSPKTRYSRRSLVPFSPINFVIAYN